MAIQQFRQAVYQTLCKRAAALMNLLDALTGAQHVESPVALSEEEPFRQQFSAVYDALENGAIDIPALPKALAEHLPSDSERIAGREIYAIDATANPRPDAETLRDRGLLKSEKDAPARPGFKFSWLARLVQHKPSWVAPLNIERIPTASCDTQVAVEQVRLLDKLNCRLKVIVADSLYGNHVFLAVFLTVKTVVALVRLRQNQNLYEAPPPRTPGQKGRPRKHGPAFKLKSPPRPAERTETFELKGQTVWLQAWTHLHLYKLPTLAGLLLRVEFLKADGTPRYKRPLWLFWTGPTDAALADLCRMYLWRFAIEHAFRFLKQHGLNACRSTNPIVIEHWIWLHALAYWQLLLMRQEVNDLRPAWQPRVRDNQVLPLTVGQTLRGARRFLLELGSPAPSVRPAGKGTGRVPGYRPKPRPRYPVVRKGQKPRKTPETRAPAVV